METTRCCQQASRPAGQPLRLIGRNTQPVTSVSGQRELGARSPAQGDGGPRAPKGPNSPLCGSESAKVGGPHSA
eukprot:5244296-Alexandrium_andersonii.AAC.1